MSYKPLKNSKGVDKPFRSPFSTPRSNNANTANTPELNKSEPLKSLLTKRKLFEETPPCKRSCLNTESDDDHVREHKEILYQSDLELLKQRIRQKEESLAAIKTSLLYRKKNKAEDLENAIKKWTEGCQVALQDYQRHLEERNGQTVSMSDIFSSLNITPDIVRYSVDDDTFY